MNSVIFFKNNELYTDIARYDKHEGIALYAQPKSSFLELNGHQFNMENIGSPITMYFYKNNSKNIFCMWSLATNADGFFRDDDIFIDEKNKDFGEDVVVLTSPQLFLERVIEAVKKRKLNTKIGLVNYYDETEHKNFADNEVLFNKLSKFSYQKEYRVVIDTNIENNPYILEIGDLSDICIITTIAEFNKNIKVIQN